MLLKWSSPKFSPILNNLLLESIFKTLDNGSERFRSSLCDHMYELQQKGSLCDIQIDIADSGLAVELHSVVLAGACQKFREEFSVNEEGDSTVFTVLANLDNDTLTQVVRYIYTGMMDLEQCDVVKLLYCCHQLELDSVVHVIEMAQLKDNQSEVLDKEMIATETQSPTIQNEGTNSLDIEDNKNTNNGSEIKEACNLDKFPTKLDTVPRENQRNGKAEDTRDNGGKPEDDTSDKCGKVEDDISDKCGKAEDKSDNCGTPEDDKSDKCGKAEDKSDNCGTPEDDKSDKCGKDEDDKSDNCGKAEDTSDNCGTPEDDKSDKCGKDEDTSDNFGKINTTNDVEPDLIDESIQSGVIQNERNYLTSTVEVSGNETVQFIDKGETIESKITGEEDVKEGNDLAVSNKLLIDGMIIKIGDNVEAKKEDVECQMRDEDNSSTESELSEKDDDLFPRRNNDKITQELHSDEEVIEEVLEEYVYEIEEEELNAMEFEANGSGQLEEENTEKKNSDPVNSIVMGEEMCVGTGNTEVLGITQMDEQIVNILRGQNDDNEVHFEVLLKTPTKDDKVTGGVSFKDKDCKSLKSPLSVGTIWKNRGRGLGKRNIKVPARLQDMYCEFSDKDCIDGDDGDDDESGGNSDTLTDEHEPTQEKHTIKKIVQDIEKDSDGKFNKKKRRKMKTRKELALLKNDVTTISSSDDEVNEGGAHKLHQRHFNIEKGITGIGVVSIKKPIIVMPAVGPTCSRSLLVSAQNKQSSVNTIPTILSTKNVITTTSVLTKKSPVSSVVVVDKTGIYLSKDGKSDFVKSTNSGIRNPSKQLISAPDTDRATSLNSVSSVTSTNQVKVSISKIPPVAPIVIGKLVASPNTSIVTVVSKVQNLLNSESPTEKIRHVVVYKEAEPTKLLHKPDFVKQKYNNATVVISDSDSDIFRENELDVPATKPKKGKNLVENKCKEVAQGETGIGMEKATVSTEISSKNKLPLLKDIREKFKNINTSMKLESSNSQKLVNERSFDKQKSSSKSMDILSNQSSTDGELTGSLSGKTNLEEASLKLVNKLREASFKLKLDFERQKSYEKSCELNDNNDNAKCEKSSEPNDNYDNANCVKSFEPNDNTDNAKRKRSSEPNDNTDNAKCEKSSEPNDNNDNAKFEKSCEPNDNSDNAKCEKSSEPTDNNDNAKCKKFFEPNDNVNCEKSSESNDNNDSAKYKQSSDPNDNVNCEKSSESNDNNDHAYCEKSSEPNDNNDNTKCKKSSEPNDNNDHAYCENSSEPNHNDNAKCETSSEPNDNNDHAYFEKSSEPNHNSNSEAIQSNIQELNLKNNIKTQSLCKNVDSKIESLDKDGNEGNIITGTKIMCSQNVDDPNINHESSVHEIEVIDSESDEDLIQNEMSEARIELIRSSDGVEDDKAASNEEMEKGGDEDDDDDDADVSFSPPAAKPRKNMMVLGVRRSRVKSNVVEEDMGGSRMRTMSSRSSSWSPRGRKVSGRGGRGRPRKDLTDESVNEDTDGELRESKARGRPPRRSLECDFADEDSVAENDEGECGEEQVQSSSRGRPRKSHVEDSNKEKLHSKGFKVERRGRPTKKNKGLFSDEPCEEGENQAECGSKGRGTPQKNVLEDSDYMDEFDEVELSDETPGDEPHTVVQVRGRGRPPKKSLTKEPGEGNLDQAKTRGRPRKIAKEERLSTDSTNDGSVNHGKGRGRPGKSFTTDVKDEPETCDEGNEDKDIKNGGQIVKGIDIPSHIPTEVKNEEASIAEAGCCGDNVEIKEEKEIDERFQDSARKYSNSGRRAIKKPRRFEEDEGYTSPHYNRDTSPNLKKRKLSVDNIDSDSSSINTTTNQRFRVSDLITPKKTAQKKGPKMKHTGRKPKKPKLEIEYIIVNKFRSYNGIQWGNMLFEDPQPVISLLKMNTHPLLKLALEAHPEPYKIPENLLESLKKEDTLRLEIIRQREAEMEKLLETVKTAQSKTPSGGKKTPGTTPRPKGKRRRSDGTDSGIKPKKKYKSAKAIKEYKSGKTKVAKDEQEKIDPNELTGDEYEIGLRLMMDLKYSLPKAAQVANVLPAKLKMYVIHQQNEGKINRIIFRERVRDKSVVYYCRCGQKFFTIMAVNYHCDDNVCDFGAATVFKKCGKCKIPLWDELTFLEHYEEEHNNMNVTLKCNYCDYHTHFSKLMIMHMKSDHDIPMSETTKSTVFKCDMKGCDYETLYDYALILHTRCHALRCFRCRHCDDTFEEYQDMIEHSFTHRDPVVTRCNECGQEFHDTGEWKDHLLFEHDAKICLSVTKINDNEVSETDTAYTCPFCPEFEATSKHKLAVHNFSHHRTGNENQSRPVHSFSTPPVSSSSRGGGMALGSSLPIIPDVPNACDICGCYTAESTVKLAIHKYRDHGEEFDSKKHQLYPCAHCPFASQNGNVYKLHTQSHEGLTYTCKQCGRGFYTETEYKQHAAVHGLKAHRLRTCMYQWCGFTCVLEPNMEKHLLVKHLEQLDDFDMGTETDEDVSRMAMDVLGQSGLDIIIPPATTAVTPRASGAAHGDNTQPRRSPGAAGSFVNKRSPFKKKRNKWGKPTKKTTAKMVSIIKPANLTSNIPLKPAPSTSKTSTSKKPALAFSTWDTIFSHTMETDGPVKDDTPLEDIQVHNSGASGVHFQAIDNVASFHSKLFYEQPGETSTPEVSKAVTLNHLNSESQIIDVLSVSDMNTSTTTMDAVLSDDTNQLFKVLSIPNMTTTPSKDSSNQLLNVLSIPDMTTTPSKELTSLSSNQGDSQDVDGDIIKRIMDLNQDIYNMGGNVNINEEGEDKDDINDILNDLGQPVDIISGSRSVSLNSGVSSINDKGNVAGSTDIPCMTLEFTATGEILIKNDNAGSTVIQESDLDWNG